MLQAKRDSHTFVGCTPAEVPQTKKKKKSHTFTGCAPKAIVNQMNTGNVSKTLGKFLRDGVERIYNGLFWAHIYINLNWTERDTGQVSGKMRQTHFCWMCSTRCTAEKRETVTLLLLDVLQQKFCRKSKTVTLFFDMCTEPLPCFVGGNWNLWLAWILDLKTKSQIKGCSMTSKRLSCWPGIHWYRQQCRISKQTGDTLTKIKCPDCTQDSYSTISTL